MLPVCKYDAIQFGIEISTEITHYTYHASCNMSVWVRAAKAVVQRV